MAVPKRKVSKQRSATRYANWKISAPPLAECPQCHEMKQNHCACKKCGYYDGAPVVKIKDKKAKE